ncbi:hypothetical protein ACLOJK_030288 [Asimina triloba]
MCRNGKCHILNRWRKRRKEGLQLQPHEGGQTLMNSALLRKFTLMHSLKPIVENAIQNWELFEIVEDGVNKIKEPMNEWLQFNPNKSQGHQLCIEGPLGSGRFTSQQSNDVQVNTVSGETDAN